MNTTSSISFSYTECNSTYPPFDMQFERQFYVPEGMILLSWQSKENESHDRGGRNWSVIRHPQSCAEIGVQLSLTVPAGPYTPPNAGPAGRASGTIELRYRPMDSDSGEKT